MCVRVCITQMSNSFRSLQSVSEGMRPQRLVSPRRRRRDVRPGRQFPRRSSRQRQRRGVEFLVGTDGVSDDESRSYSSSFIVSPVPFVTEIFFLTFYLCFCPVHADNAGLRCVSSCHNVLPLLCCSQLQPPKYSFPITRHIRPPEFSVSLL